MTIQNCTIRSTMLGFEDHGIFTNVLYLEGAGWGVGFGTFGFSHNDRDTRKVIFEGNALGEYIVEVLRVVGASSWEELVGRHVRFDDRDSNFGADGRLGHFNEDKWFSPREWFAARG